MTTRPKLPRPQTPFAGAPIISSSDVPLPPRQIPSLPSTPSPAKLNPHHTDVSTVRISSVEVRRLCELCGFSELGLRVCLSLLQTNRPLRVRLQHASHHIAQLVDGIHRQTIGVELAADAREYRAVVALAKRENVFTFRDVHRLERPHRTCISLFRLH